MRPNVRDVFELLATVKSRFPNVKIKFAGTEEAAVAHLGLTNHAPPKLIAFLQDSKLIVEVTGGKIFGPQPFLAFETKDNKFYHDNLDVLISKKRWSYIFDDQTITISNINRIGVTTAGKNGKFHTFKIIL